MANIISSVDGILNVYDDGTIDIVGGSLHIDGTEVLAGTNSATFTGLVVDSPTLVVDANNDRVGIGTATPSDKLHVEGNIRIASGGSIKGPATFTIDPATHGDNTGTVVIAGNLQVDGTTTTINSTTVEVDDKNIVLASGAANSAAADGGGITIDGAGVNLTWDDTNTRVNLNKQLYVNANGTFETTSTDAVFTVGVTDTSSYDAKIRIAGARTGCNTCDISMLEFRNSTANPYNLAQISAMDPSGDHLNGNGKLVFRTSSGGTLSDRLVIQNDGIYIADYITHDGDTNTKMGFTSADTIDLITNGNTAISVTSAEIILNNTQLEFGTSHVSGASAYSPTESGSTVVRNWLNFDLTNNASTVELTNRTPNGKLILSSGIAAGGGETQRIRINGGDGNQYVDILNSTLYIQNTTGLGTISTNSTGLIVGDVGGFNIAFDPNEIQARNNGANNVLILNKHGGNVGIGGETAPGASVEIKGAATTSTELLWLSNSNGSEKIKFGLENTGAGQVYILDGSNNNNIYFSAHNADNSWINAGNVGIGTNAPGQKLDVVGNIQFTGYLNKIRTDEIMIQAQDSSGNYSIYHTINDSQGNYNIMLGVNGAGQYANTNDGGAKVYLTGHGTAGYTSINAANTGTAGNVVSYNIGLGVDSASAAVYVGDPNDNVGLDATADGYKIADNTGRIFGTDILGNQTYTSPGQIALSRSNNNPYLSFHHSDGSRNGYIQTIGGGTMYIANEESGQYTFRAGTAVSDPPRIQIEADSQGTTAPGDMYGQLQFKVVGANGVNASGITGTDVNTIAMITAQDFRNGSGKTNEDSGLGFYTTPSGGALSYRGGISNEGKWFVGTWNNDNNGDGSLLNVNGDSYFSGNVKTDGISVDAVVAFENWSGGNNTVGSAHNLGTWTFSGGTYESPGTNYYGVDTANLPSGLGYQIWVGGGTSILTSPTINLAKYRPMTNGSQYSSDVNDAFSDAKLFLTCWVAVQSMDDASEYMAIEVKSDANTNWTEKARLSEDNDVESTNTTDTTWHKITIDITNFAETNFQVRFVGTGVGSGDGYGVSSIYIHQATLPAKLSLRTLEINETGSVNALNVADVFKFNPSTDLFTITNNQNTGGINIDGANGRLYFNGIRALEGNSSGLMSVGEGMSTVYIPNNAGIGTSAPAVKLDVVGTIRSQDGEPRLVLHDTSNSYGGGSQHHIDFSTTGGNMGYIGVNDTSEGTIEISNDPSHSRIVDNTGVYNDIRIVPNGTVRISRDMAHTRYMSVTGINESMLQIASEYDATGSQNITFSRLDGNWLDGNTGADTQYGMVFNYQNNARGGFVYDHRSTERLTMWSSYGRIGLLIPSAVQGSAVPGTYGSFNEALTVAVGGNIGIGQTAPKTDLNIGEVHDSPGEANRVLNWYATTGGTEIGNANIGLSYVNNSDNTAQPMAIGVALANKSSINQVWSPAITFGAESTSGNYMTGSAAIAVQNFANSDTNFRGGVLHFFTSGLTNPTPDTRGLVSRMVIDAEGNIGIGVTNPSAKFEVHGTAGQLFSVTDDLTGTIFAVNDTSGIPSIEVEDDGTVKLAEYGGNVLVGISTDNGADVLQVGGNITATGDVTAYGSSDARLKTNLEPIADAVDKVNTLTGYTFNWNDLAVGKDTTVREAGIIAQDVDAVLPEVVTTRKDGYMAVKYEKIVPLLIEAIKEQDDKIKRLEALVEKLMDEK